jgi:hypothetical protein
MFRFLNRYLFYHSRWYILQTSQGGCLVVLNFEHLFGSSNRTLNRRSMITVVEFLSHSYKFKQCTEVRFASFFSGGSITAIVVNLPERKLTKCTFVQCVAKIHHL